MTTTRPPPWDGSAANPYQYIQDGIDAAVSGVDTVLVKDGTYTGTLNKNLNFGGKAITVMSQNGSSACIIDCEDSGQGFYFGSGEGATSVLQGFTITNGSATAGGGICCSGSSPTISYCRITGNLVSDDGGGIYCVSSSSPAITGCTISHNTAGDNGGGVYCTASSHPTISGCSITDNTADGQGGGMTMLGGSDPTLTGCSITSNTANRGGGFYWYDSDPTLTDCTVSYNESTGSGGAGIFCYGSSATITGCTVTRNETSGGTGGGITSFDHTGSITNCTISGNSAWRGGGIECYTSSASITNCVIASNTASFRGGAVWLILGSNPQFTNCTITDNEAPTGGGMYFSDSGGTTLVNCILWGDSSQEIYVASGGNPTVDYCDVQGGWLGTGNIDADPLFIDAGSPIMVASFMNFRLRPGSPCIDAATSSKPAPLTDMEGRARYDDPTTPNTGGGASPYYDMGAYEFKAYYVNGDPAIGSNSFDGLEPIYNIVTGHGPELTIQAGINDAVDGDVVSVAPYTYTGLGNRDLHFSGTAAALISEAGAATTIIDCEGADQGFSLASGEPRTTVIDGFTITNGGSVNYGGGIACWLGSTPTILNCVVTDCSVASCGGAVCFDRSPARLVNCALIGNTADQYGGGIECYDTWAYIEQCTIMGNTAGWDGGGMWCTSSGQLPYVKSCLIARNSTAASGGGIYYDGAIGQIANCTIAYNTAAVSGGGLQCMSGSANMNNCILWGNSPDEIAGTGTPTLYYCDVDGGWAGVGSNNINADPNFVYVRADKYRLRPGSPCIDAGSGSDLAAPVDIEGRPRYDDPMTPNTGGGSEPYFDIGAYEFKGYYVNDATGNDAWSGLMPYWDGVDGPKETVQAGIDAAGDGDLVSVAPGTYTGVDNYDLDFGGKPITLMSEGGTSCTTINADGAGRVLDFSSGETGMAIVLGFTLSKGLPPGGAGFGGCIRCDGSSPSILACRVVGGTSQYGGGIGCLNTGADALILDCEIDHNLATLYGGAIECHGSSPTITNCLIHHNEAMDEGGAIDLDGAMHPTITQCTLSMNVAGTGGGGIYSLDSGESIRDCILWGDTPDEFNWSLGLNILTYCDVQDGTGEAWFGTGCLDKDPLFVSGLLHDCYLSQTAAGQGFNSACVNAGSDTAAGLDCDELTTRTDHVRDTGTVDMGYHSPSCLGAMPGDVDGNGVVDGLDLTAVLTAWKTVPGDPLWDPRADLDCNGGVDGLDLTEVISNWTTGAAAAPPTASGPTETEPAKPGRRGSRPGNVNKGKGNAGRT